jgi:hypothetical protein
MPVKLARRRIIAAAVEGTYGVDATPTGADAILIEDVQQGFDRLTMVERPAIRDTLGRLQQIYGGALKAYTFTCEVKGSGAAGTPPEIGVLLRGCAMDETIVAATSVTYAPISDNQESLTIYLWEDGTLTKLLGARGSVDFVGEARGRLMANFQFIGHYAGPTDVALPTPTYDATKPPILIGGSLQIGAFTPAIQAFNFSPGNVIEVPPNINAADGFSEVLITDKDPAGSINPEQPLVATLDFIGQLTGGTTVALDTGVFGATAGNRFAVTAPAAYWRDMAPGVREGVQIYEIPFGLAETSGDDQFAIAFT